uniref:Uncharacterized protein n=1 Tax=Trichobilharzia regenti TaxID=157069 RepID=A0AA85JZ09_TRIRE|nr:unnamed protein product [Trichobilharzia regenti]
MADPKIFIAILSVCILFEYVSEAAIEQLQHQISLLDACCKANAQRIRDNEASIDELFDRLSRMHSGSPSSGPSSTNNHQEPGHEEPTGDAEEPEAPDHEEQPGDSEEPEVCYLHCLAVHIILDDQRNRAQQIYVSVQQIETIVLDNEAECHGHSEWN